MIRLKELQVRYGGRVVLDVPDESFETGQLHLLVGHNGSGKTTLLKIINGLISPTSGCAEVNCTQLEMALCHQQPYLFNTTVEKNINFGLRFRRHKPANALMRDLIKRLRVEQLLERNASTLSSGEAQRVALARALILEPRLLLLDEPTANLDPESVECIENEILRLSAQERTVLMVTHRVEQAFHLTDHVKRLEKGRIVEPEIRNLVEGCLEERDGEIFLISEEGREGFCVVTSMRGKARVAIPPADIILSLRPLEGSMRNCVKGRISSLVENKGRVLVRVNAGIPLDVFVTHTSVSEMNLSIGTDVYASFKATAVKIF